MGRKRNLTIQLDQETIEKARVLAAKRGTSISGLMRQQLEELVSQEDQYEMAKQRALYYLKHPPFNLGGKYPKREELYDRKVFRR